ncbi:nuclear speckle RNA-binding protein A-like [Balamuthia mandrillaris]
MEEASSTLFVADLPQDLQEPEFHSLFQGCEGFVGARLRRDRIDNIVGFVDFSDHECASIAKERYDHYKFNTMSENGITIHFAHGSTSRTKRNRDLDEGYHREVFGRGSGPAVGQLDRGLQAPLQNGIPMMMPMSGHMTTDISGMPFYASPFPSTFAYNNLSYPPLPVDSSSTLYVEGLPLDATEREVAHIFRPFPGFLSLRILPKESKQYPNRTYNLCFVEFDNKYQATAAMQAIQGYKFAQADTKGLNISYAKTSRKDRRRGGSGSGGAALPPQPLGNGAAAAGGPGLLPALPDGGSSHHHHHHHHPHQHTHHSVLGHPVSSQTGAALPLKQDN